MFSQVENMIRKYKEVYRHSVSVRDLATAFAYHLGYSEKEVMKIRHGSYIHDVGKAFIDGKVLLKDGKLSDKEYTEIKKHADLGYQYLHNNQFVIDEDALAIVLQHHEREDGLGYPHKLSGEQIHPYAKLVSVCDVYDAITSVRSYKVAYSSSHALYCIEEGSGTQFNKIIAEQFLNFMKDDKLQNKIEIKKTHFI